MTISDQTKSRIWLAAVVILIFSESCCSRAELPESIPSADKVGHFLLYGLLATHAHLSGLTRGRAWLTILCVSFFGATDELHQHFTPGRSMDIFDWLSDTLGAALAVFMLLKVSLYRRLLEFRIR